MEIDQVRFGCLGELRIYLLAISYILQCLDQFEYIYLPGVRSGSNSGAVDRAGIKCTYIDFVIYIVILNKLLGFVRLV